MLFFEKWHCKVGNDPWLQVLNVRNVSSQTLLDKGYKHYSVSKPIYEVKDLISTEITSEGIKEVFQYTYIMDLERVIRA